MTYVAFGVAVNGCLRNESFYQTPVKKLRDLKGMKILLPSNEKAHGRLSVGSGFHLNSDRLLEEAKRLLRAGIGLRQHRRRSGSENLTARQVRRLLGKV